MTVLRISETEFRTRLTNTIKYNTRFQATVGLDKVLSIHSLVIQKDKWTEECKLSRSIYNGRSVIYRYQFSIGDSGRLAVITVNVHKIDRGSWWVG